MAWGMTGLMAYLAYCLQMIVWPALGSGPYPDMPLAAMAAAGWCFGPWAGGVFGLALGIAEEGVFSTASFVYALPLVLCGAGCGFVRRLDWRGGWLIAGGILLVCIAGQCVAEGLIAGFAGVSFSLSGAIYRWILPEIAMTMAVGLGLMALLGRLTRSREPRQGAIHSIRRIGN
nr:hypothetical protein [bacterium]